MLALIVKAALETAFKPILDQEAWTAVSALAWSQLAVFFVLMLRFYIGALRYVEMEPKNLDLVIRTINLVFAFILFCNFYVIALSVTHPEYFYYLVISLHLIDGVWFLVALTFSFLKVVPEHPGEIKISATRRVMITFLFFDFLTVLFAAIWYYLIFPQQLTSKTETSADWAFLATLIAISFLDFWALNEYYFKIADWRTKHAVPQ